MGVLHADPPVFGPGSRCSIVSAFEIVNARVVGMTFLDGKVIDTQNQTATVSFASSHTCSEIRSLSNGIASLCIRCTVLAGACCIRALCAAVEPRAVQPDVIHYNLIIHKEEWLSVTIRLNQIKLRFAPQVFYLWVSDSNNIIMLVIYKPRL